MSRLRGGVGKASYFSQTLRLENIRKVIEICTENWQKMNQKMHLQCTIDLTFIIKKYYFGEVACGMKILE